MNTLETILTYALHDIAKELSFQLSALVEADHFGSKGYHLKVDETLEIILVVYGEDLVFEYGMDLAYSDSSRMKANDMQELVDGLRELLEQSK